VNFKAKVNEMPDTKQNFLWTLTDYNCRYISDLQVCYGRHDGLTKSERSNKQIVKNLVEPFRHPKRKFSYHPDSALFWSHFADDHTSVFERNVWTHSMFFSLVDFAVINTFTCCQAEKLIPASFTSWSQYMKLLSYELVFPMVRNRVSIGSIRLKRYPQMTDGAQQIIDHLNEHRSKDNQLKLKTAANKRNANAPESDDSDSCDSVKEIADRDSEENSDLDYPPVRLSSSSLISLASNRVTRSRSNPALNLRHCDLDDEPDVSVTSAKSTKASISVVDSITIDSDSEDEKPTNNDLLTFETDRKPRIVAVRSDVSARPKSNASSTSKENQRIPSITYSTPSRPSGAPSKEDCYTLTGSDGQSGVLKACFFCSQNDLTPAHKRRKYSNSCASCYKYICSTHARIVFKCIDCCEK
jgi:hypothetical protein